MRTAPPAPESSPNPVPPPRTRPAPSVPPLAAGGRTGDRFLSPVSCPYPSSPRPSFSSHSRTLHPANVPIIAPRTLIRIRGLHRHTARDNRRVSFLYVP